MKHSILTISILMALSLMFASCGKDSDNALDELKGNAFQIKVNGEVYEEGRNLFAGIATYLGDEEAMQAGYGTTLGIVFAKADYVAGKPLTVGLAEMSGVNALATGVLVMNKDTEDEDLFSFTAVGGTAKIVSKKRIEFNLICYRLTDLDYDDELNYTGPVPGAKKYVVSGYVTEQEVE